MPWAAAAAPAAAGTGAAAGTTAAVGTTAAAGSGWTAAAIGTSIAAAGVQTYSAYEQGKSQKAMADYNADVAKAEAAQLDKAGSVAAKEIRDNKRRILSSQNVAYAKSGVQSAGTPLLVEINTAADEEYNAMMTSYNYGVKSSQALSSSRLSRMTGRSASRAGVLGAGSSLFSGASDIARIKLSRSGY